MLFKDRQDAGRKLALALHAFKNRDDVCVLALPRGGVVLGYEISKALHLPFDLILVRKLGVPWQEELALGAVAIPNIRVLNQSILSTLNIREKTIEEVTRREQAELDRRNRVYRQNRPFPPIKDKIVIIVDDGIATGATMRAAIRVVASMKPQKIIVAVPVASYSVFKEMRGEQVELLVLETPEPFYGIGMWYGQFPQLTDEEVITLLA
jgi:putative phosphoribosyl transferase